MSSLMPYKNRFAILAEPSDEEESVEPEKVGEETEEEEMLDDASSDKAVLETNTEKTIREQMLESDTAKEWGISSDGENQGVRHFYDYWLQYPRRIPALALRLGVDSSLFDNSLVGFANFTQQAQHVVSAATRKKQARRGRGIYYLAGTRRKDRGVIVIVQGGKLQSMMPSDPDSFKKMK